jgi:hypothetical protein
MMITTGMKNARPLKYVSARTATAQIENMIDFIAVLRLSDMI